MTTPKLRFKEFDGDWTNCTLKDFTTFAKGKGISKADITEDGENFCIRYGELYTMYGHVIDKIRSKTNVSKSDSVLSKANDVIIPASGETQIDIATASCVLHDDIILSGDLNIVSHQENGVWLAYYLSSAKKLEIAQLAQGNSVVHLYSSQLKELKINKPSKQEQTKIASFLSAVDEKISQLTQKHELLIQYKQGMMQKLFSQQIRFKADDGSEFGEWEETVLEKIGAFLKGKGISKADIVEDGFTPCIRYGELYTHYGEVISKVISATNLEIENLILSKANDVLIPASGETQIDIATASCVLHDDVALSGDLNIFRTKENGVFLSYLIRSHLKMQIAQLAQGNSVVHLYSSQLKGVRLNLPCLEEQTKIANFLSAIDQKIDVVAQQIEQAKMWKKGLLQQMFV